MSRRKGLLELLTTDASFLFTFLTVLVAFAVVGVTTVAWGPWGALVGSLVAAIPVLIQLKIYAE